MTCLLLFLPLFSYLFPLSSRLWGNAPLLLCDQCQHPIRDAGLALCTWRERPRQTFEGSREQQELLRATNEAVLLVDGGSIYTLHKACADTFEAAHGGRAYWWPWMELVDLLAHLAHNSGFDMGCVQRWDTLRDLVGRL